MGVQSTTDQFNCWRKFAISYNSSITIAALHESAFGPKRTSLAAPHMSAFGGKADMALCIAYVRL